MHGERVTMWQQCNDNSCWVVNAEHGKWRQRYDAWSTEQAPRQVTSSEAEHVRIRTMYEAAAIQPHRDVSDNAAFISSCSMSTKGEGREEDAAARNDVI
jgi:hypothetical protein